MLNLNDEKARTLIANKEIIINTAATYKDYLDSPLNSQQNPLSDILSYIESLARKTGGTILDMKPGKEANKTSIYSTYTIEIGLQGTLSQITNFIVDLQKSDILVEVQRATLIPKEDQLQFKAKLSVFVF